MYWKYQNIKWGFFIFPYFMVYDLVPTYLEEFTVLWMINDIIDIWMNETVNAQFFSIQNRLRKSKTEILVY